MFPGPWGAEPCCLPGGSLQLAAGEGRSPGPEMPALGCLCPSYTEASLLPQGLQGSELVTAGEKTQLGRRREGTGSWRWGGAQGPSGLYVSSPSNSPHRQTTASFYRRRNQDTRLPAPVLPAPRTRHFPVLSPALPSHPHASPGWQGPAPPEATDDALRCDPKGRRLPSLHPEPGCRGEEGGGGPWNRWMM